MSVRVPVYQIESRKVVKGLTYSPREGKLYLTPVGTLLKVEARLFGPDRQGLPIDESDYAYASDPGVCGLPGWAITYAVSEGAEWIERSEDSRTRTFARAYWLGEVPEGATVVGKRSTEIAFSLPRERFEAWGIRV